MTSRRNCALIVTFNPDFDLLWKVISSLENGVDKFFLFDNSKISEKFNLFIQKLRAPIYVFRAEGNVGIATAQNTLLKAALREGFDLALMSDQDTIYPKDYFSNLSKYCNIKSNVAAVCPGWLDANLEGLEIYPGQFVYFSRFSLKIDKTEPEFLEISHAISSGMIVNLHNIDKIGLMNDDLFIDWVDNEWCWRAGVSGCKILAIPSIKVNHLLGDSTNNILGRSFVKRGSVRNYYIVRNALYLILYKPIPLCAKIYLSKKFIHHSIFCIAASDRKLAESFYIFKAWIHGLVGRLGKY